MYVELHAASAFSFLQAASLPETLVEQAKVLKYEALALIDSDGVYGAPRFHKAATDVGIRPLIGAALTIVADVHAGRGDTSTWCPAAGAWVPAADSWHPADVREIGTRLGTDVRSETAPRHTASVWRVPRAAPCFSLPVLVASTEGWQNLCRLITTMKLRAPKGEGALTLQDLDGQVSGLVALPGHALLQVNRANRDGAREVLDHLVGIFGTSNVHLALQRHLIREQEDDNDWLSCLAGTFRLPVVATGGVRFAMPEERPLFDVLTAIREHVPLARAGRLLSMNAERYLKSPAQMARLFADRPEAVRATRTLADRLQFSMKELGYRFPPYPVPPGETEISYLRKMTDAGARNRYRPYHDRARTQVERELALIEHLELAGYFLIVWDIVCFCRREDILVQGRGSAVNSAVCYSLGITALDPIDMDLLFERFLSLERHEWPDIDLDLPSGERRERVIQYVYERYGRYGAAMTANVITYRGRSAAREVGKAFGMDEGIVDRLSKVMHHFEYVDPDDTLTRQLAEVGLVRDDPRVRHFAQVWQQMQDLPRHLGQHPGGMVICQGLLSSVVPLENTSMPGRVVVQWDKDDCAAMGIVKVDLLGLGMMAVLQDAIRLVNARVTAGHSQRSLPQAPSGEDSSGSWFDLAHLPADDQAVYDLLCAADTIGVFQVESRAQMATLPRLKPRKFYDLVVEVALIRPGPVVGQMVHPYLNRRAKIESVTYDHPLLEPILERTLGVPLFQEQLLRMAMAVAGFTGGQAEDLRRAMGSKRSEKRMQPIERQLRRGMAGNGITGEAADRIVRSITSFALFGFPESHAASFALIAYASAYLKVHFPEVFYTALLNNQPMGFYHPATLVKDAERRKVRFEPIDVQVSDWDCTIDEDGAIRLGLRQVSGLRAEVGKAIAARRAVPSIDSRASAEGSVRGSREERVVCPKCGCDDPSMIDGTFCNVCSHAWTPAPVGRRFGSVDELIRVTGLRRDEVAVLADIGALDSFGMDRRSALWQAEHAVRPAGRLFEEVSVDRSGRSPLPLMSEEERLVADYAGTNLTLGAHPMSFRRQDLAKRGVLRAIDLPKGQAGRRVRTAGMVITRQRPGTAKGFVFLTLEDETGVSNIIVRPAIYAAARLVIVESPFLLVEGVLQNADGVTAIRGERFVRLAGLPDDAAVASHDFH